LGTWEKNPAMTASPFLFLDIGQVLVGIRYEPLAEKLQAATGIDRARLQTVLTAGNLVEKYETGVITDTEFYREVCRRAGNPVPWAVFLDAWNSIFTDPLLEQALLTAVAQKNRLWALSNTNGLHFDFLRRRFAFLDHFEGFVLSYEVGALKPDERIFRHALKKAGADCEDALFVDDQEANVAAARTLGIDAFRFLDAARFIIELEARGRY
jgi:FMN phosphatase YigB (HAD superfamily)